MMNKTLKSLLAAVACITVAPSAQAALINNNSGLANPASEITFDEVILADQTELLNTYQAYGVTFAPGMRYGTTNYGIPNSSPPNAVNFFGFVDPFRIFFTSSQTQAAMVIATNAATPNTILTALLGGVTVESFNITTSQTGANNYFGFTSILFDEVQISNTSSGIVVDNIQFGFAVVPEPGTIALLGLALAGLGFARRCKLD